MRKIILAALLIIAACAGYGQSVKQKRPAPRTPLEQRIIDTISKLPEVREEEKRVSVRSEGNRHLKYTIFEKPRDKSKYYWVKVWEDNGANYVTHFNFYIDPNDFDILYKDVENDMLIKYNTWKESRNIVR